MVSNNSAHDYAGDMSASDAWTLLQQDASAQLVDVRTTAEWNFVGLADLSSVGRDVLAVEWQSFPTMRLNPTFVTDLERMAKINKDTALLFICRSGARSRSAAMAMAAAGYSRAYNVAGGFEGDLDADGHRGHKNGWKARGLPWKQS